MAFLSGVFPEKLKTVKVIPVPRMELHKTWIIPS